MKKKSQKNITMAILALTVSFSVGCFAMTNLFPGEASAGETENILSNETESEISEENSGDLQQSESEIQDSDTVEDVTVELFGEEYTGTYTGEVSKDVPSGEGTFVSDDGEAEAEGTWRRGKLNGETTITYQDGTTVTGTYKKGTENGLFTKTSEDGSVVEEDFYDNGDQCGAVSIYEDGVLTERGLYVNGFPLEEFKNDSVRLTKEVIDSKEYLDSCVYIEGLVEYVGRDSSNCYVRISDETLGGVFFSYKDTKASGADQAVIPNLERSDRVRIYGLYDFYTEDQEDDDIKGYGYYYTSLKPVYGELLDNKQETKYDELFSEPYTFFGVGVRDSFTVQNYIKKGSKFLIFAVRDGDKEDQLYVIELKNTEMEGFLGGTRLKIYGYYCGQYRKERQTKGKYNIYPFINAVSVEEE